jgi:hypothetical protein
MKFLVNHAWVINTTCKTYQKSRILHKLAIYIYALKIYKQALEIFNLYALNFLYISSQTTLL